ncbi:MAG: hypothetical protein KTR16_11525 [Acidiferrobacterales bacterium]|nr:hypothetical protein [Acidiferrobacterales bacterium]
MSEAKFTKGEWVASEGVGGGAIVYIPNGGFDISGIPDAIFNAHLIAAAPEMYEFIETHMGGYPEAEDLLAKARGEQ